VKPTSQLPPEALRTRVGGHPDDYYEIGRAHVGLIQAMLPAAWTWADRRVLDFGCGSGRTLVPLAIEAPDADLWGCDIDGRSIEWAQNNLSSEFHFLENDELPPLELAEATFDLVYGMSVFTHLVDTWSDWLLEVHRVLKVGGYGIFSFLGEGMIRDVTGREWNEDRVGMIGLDVGRAWDEGGPNALHSEWWLRAHWGRLFEVEEVMPYADVAQRYGHGFVLLRKDGRATPSSEELERVDSDDPREIASLQFNVELLQDRAAVSRRRDDDASPVNANPSRVLVPKLTTRLVNEAGRRLPEPVKRRIRTLLGEKPRDPWPSVGGDTWFHDHFDYAADEISAFLAGYGISLVGREVADVGAGDGIIDLGVALKAKPSRLVGFDVNLTDTGNLLEQARKQGVAEELPPSLEFVKSDVTTIPAEDDSFDAVITWSAFEHIADPPALMREIKRILRPSGVLFLQLWPFYRSEHGGHLWEWFPGEAFVALRHAPEEIAAVMRANPQGDLSWVEQRLRDYQELNKIRLDDLQQALVGAGFRIGRIELLTNTVHLPPDLDRGIPLSDLMIAGVKLLALPT
jgi:ubiquinone/menaquinone biosynthesis C-methylase UbiE